LARDFTVIVPTYDRPVPLAKCIRALRAQDYDPESFEVVVVDDGSRKPPDLGLGPIGDRFRVIVASHGGPGRARNRGAQEACGRWIAFTDDDCEPEPSWLSALARAFRAGETGALGGRTQNGLPDNPFSTASQTLIDYLYLSWNQPGSAAPLFTSNNLALPAELFRTLGGFDASFPLAAAEDRDFCDRLARAGHRLTYVPAAEVVHRHDLSLRGFFRQHLNYGRGAVRFHQLKSRRTGQASGPGLDPSFYSGLIRHVWNARVPRPFSIAALLVLSQFAGGLGYVIERFHQPRPSGRLD
jgi:GT2 family glycosyltransferase